MSEPLTLSPIGWAVSSRLVPYADAVAFMEAHAAAVAAGEAEELVWLLEHPPLYSAGTSAKPSDLLEPDRFPVFKSGRGGQFTYHGPGQRVAYVMLDVKRRANGDIRAFVGKLEAWLIAALARFNVDAGTRPERIGVWVERKVPGAAAREDKIAALGIRVRRWVSFHGVALNVEPDLSHFSGIVPCGIQDHGVTSLLDLGITVSMDDVDYALRAAFEDIFAETTDSTAPF